MRSNESLEKRNLLVFLATHLYYLLLDKEHLLVNHFAVVKGKDRSL